MNCHAHTHTHRQMHTCIRPQRFISMICLLQSINLPPPPSVPFPQHNNLLLSPNRSTLPLPLPFCCVCVYIVEVVVVFILRNNKNLLYLRIFYSIFSELNIGFLKLKIDNKKSLGILIYDVCVCIIS